MLHSQQSWLEDPRSRSRHQSSFPGRSAGASQRGSPFRANSTDSCHGCHCHRSDQHGCQIRQRFPRELEALNTELLARWDGVFDFISNLIKLYLQERIIYLVKYLNGKFLCREKKKLVQSCTKTIPIILENILGSSIYKNGLNTYYIMSMN